MSLILSIVGYVCVALATGLGVCWSFGHLIAWGLAWEARRSAAARKRRGSEPQ